MFDCSIELRGLEKGKTYTAVEYTADAPREFKVNGDDPYIHAQFERNYLLKVTENNK
jgi:hypothetical protein